MRTIKFKLVIDNKLLSETYTLDEILDKSKEDIVSDLDNQYTECHCLNEGCGHCCDDCLKAVKRAKIKKINICCDGVVDKRQ